MEMLRGTCKENWGTFISLGSGKQIKILQPKKKTLLFIKQTVGNDRMFISGLSADWR